LQINNYHIKNKFRPSKKSLAIGAFILLLTINLSAQVRVSKLVIKPKEVYELGQSDILVADTLIMMDSSRIILNRLKQENYIRAQVAYFGNACIIDGSGINGKAGRKGRDGETPIGPCKNGLDGRTGATGLQGVRGVNLFLYFSEIHIKGKILINLTGGHGGNGGNGGNGGGGSPGTVHCNGGNGGNGANGANGGSGGDGGTLTLSCTSCTYSVDLLMNTKIILANGGGSFGFGGIAGYEGPPGLGPSRRNGVSGQKGLDGTNGKSGNRGDLKIEKN
jgi:hypothetical protein